MAILGVESLIYGVQDLDLCTRFYEDFGLPLASHDAQKTVFALEEGSHIVLRREDDPALPRPFGKSPGPREIIWGVSSQAELDRIESDLKRDRAVTKDKDGTLHTRDDHDIAIGLRVWARKDVVLDGGRENSPGKVTRWNCPRKWYQRATPKLILHIVFRLPEVDKAVGFYVKRLGFKITDVSRGLGVFLRADGRFDHHNLFFMRDPDFKFHHISFGVENIDELMVGANYMQRRGWQSHFGLGRHRLSSGIFYFMPNPAGGEAEFLADSDYLNDDWKPRLWEPNFGAFQWAGKLPPMLEKDPAWKEPIILPDPVPSFSELSQAPADHFWLTNPDR